MTLTQRGLANLADAQRSTFTVDPGHRVLQFASPSFDASVFELAMALCSGATLVLPPRRDVLYGPGLGDFLADTRITHITLPPSVLAMVPERELPHLETIVCAGEALPSSWSTGGHRAGPCSTRTAPPRPPCGPRSPGPRRAAASR